MKSNKYLRAVSANYAFLVVNVGFFLFVTPIAIRVMGETNYGLWTLLLSILIFSTIGTFGMGLVVNKHAAEEGAIALPHDAIMTVATAILLPLAGVAAVILIALRGWISSGLVGDPAVQRQLSNGIVFLALSVAPLFLTRAGQGYLFSQLSYGLAQGIDTATNICMWAGAVWIGWRYGSIAFFGLWILAIQLISLSVYIVVITRRLRLRWHWDNRTFRRMANFSAFTLVQTAAVSLSQQLDRVLVGFFLGPAQAGIYSVGTSIGIRLSVFTGQITDVLIPYTSRKMSLQESDRLRQVFGEIERLVDVLLMALGSNLILWMDVILKYWISPEYSNAHANTFRVLVLAYILLSANRPGHQTLIGIGKVRVASLIYLASTLLMLLCLYIGSTLWGLFGAALANLAMVTLLASNFVAHRTLDHSVLWGSVPGNLFMLLVVPASVLAFSFSSGGSWNLRIIITLLTLLVGLGTVWGDRNLRTDIKRLFPADRKG